MNKILFSSDKEDWETPQDFFDNLNNEFHFTLDPCASKYNHKCDKYFTTKENGLDQDWSNNIVFCNPPYGRKIYKWIEKAYNEFQKGNTTIVLLIPSRTDTKYFHDFLYNKRNIELRFIKGRLRFSNSNSCAPFPSLVVIMKNKDE